jgi:hypothetical protein
LQGWVKDGSAAARDVAAAGGFLKSESTYACGKIAIRAARLGKLRRICKNSNQAEMFDLLPIVECCGLVGQPI